MSQIERRRKCLRNSRKRMTEEKVKQILWHRGMAFAGLWACEWVKYSFINEHPKRDRWILVPNAHARVGQSLVTFALKTAAAPLRGLGHCMARRSASTPAGSKTHKHVRRNWIIITAGVLRGEIPIWLLGRPRSGGLRSTVVHLEFLDEWYHKSEDDIEQGRLVDLVCTQKDMAGCECMTHMTARPRHQHHMWWSFMPRLTITQSGVAHACFSRPGISGHMPHVIKCELLYALPNYIHVVSN